MQLVAAVSPLDDVGNRSDRLRGAALREQEGLLMLIIDEAATRRIAFREDEMTDDPKSGGSPGGHELIDAVPAVETDATAVRAQHAIGFREGRGQPRQI